MAMRLSLTVWSRAYPTTQSPNETPLKAIELIRLIIQFVRVRRFRGCLQDKPKSLSLTVALHSCYSDRNENCPKNHIRVNLPNKQIQSIEISSQLTFICTL